MRKLSLPVLLVLVLNSCSNSETEYYENVENAFQALQESKPDRALKFANAAIKVGFSDHSAYMVRGRAFYEQDNLDAAKRDFATVINLDSSNTTALFYTGLILYDQNFYDSSIYYLNQAIASKGGENFYFEYSDKFLKYNYDENLTMGRLRYFRGLAFYFGGNINTALKDFAFSADEGYNTGRSYYYIGLIALEKEELGLACKYLRLAMDNGYEKAESQLPANCR